MIRTKRPKKPKITNELIRKIMAGLVGQNSLKPQETRVYVGYAKVKISEIINTNNKSIIKKVLKELIYSGYLYYIGKYDDIHPDEKRMLEMTKSVWYEILM